MSSRRSPLIVMMQPTHFWDFLNQSKLRPLDRPRYRTIHIQRPVRAPMMVILEVPGQEPSQMSLVQANHVVQAFAANTPDQPFDVGVLPRTLRGDEHFFDAHVSHPPPKGCAIDAVSIGQQISRRLVPRKGFYHLLS